MKRSARISSSRFICCQSLLAVLNHQGSLATAFTQLLAKQAKTETPENIQNPGLEPSALPEIKEICYGVCRWYFKLDHVARLYLDKPLRNKDKDIYCLILIGLFQLYYMRTPAHAAINENVSEAENLGKHWAKSLINAVLRQAQRDFPTTLPDYEEDYSVYYAHPDWIITRLKKQWPKSYREILTANNQQAPMTLRINRQHGTRESFQEQLTAAGILSRPGSLSETALYLDSPCPVNFIPGFAEGLVSVQDEASQLVSEILPLAPGLKILDACAAPGGKTCALLEKEPLIAELTALDISEKRLKKVGENLERCGLQAKLLAGDINTPDTWWDGKLFDRILLDVPCSATGVIRRNPDIKILRTEDDIIRLCELQAHILEQAWSMLNPGGFLLYSTCSVLNDENSQQIATFLKKMLDAKYRHLDQFCGVSTSFGFQLVPESGNHDGFYYALLEKC